MFWKSRGVCAISLGETFGDIFGGHRTILFTFIICYVVHFKVEHAYILQIQKFRLADFWFNFKILLIAVFASII